MRGQTQGVYRGTKMDAEFLTMGFSQSSIVEDAHMGPVAETAVRASFVVGGIIDMPISLVTDTICLPYDITRKEPNAEQSTSK